MKRIEYEGYWKDSVNQESDLPFPQESDKSVDKKFINKLTNLFFISNRGKFCRTTSVCKICKKNHKYIEYIIEGNYTNYKVQENVVHYYEEHNVQPSENFYNFIMNDCQEECTNELLIDIILSNEKEGRKNIMENQSSDFINIEYNEKYYKNEAQQMEKCRLSGDFYLDPQERRMFAQAGHAWLIEQLQNEDKSIVRFYKDKDENNSEIKQ
jgi:hypothetical protein